MEGMELLELTEEYLRLLCATSVAFELPHKFTLARDMFFRPVQYAFSLGPGAFQSEQAGGWQKAGRAFAPGTGEVYPLPGR